MTFFADVRAALVQILSNSTVRLIFRRGTAAQWTAANPILSAGEPGYETDTKKEKRGDGVTPWVYLQYVTDQIASQISYPVMTFKQFGAKGDDSTDDTAAIQAALNAVPANGILIASSGAKYVVNKTLTKPADGVTIDFTGSSIRFGDRSGLTPDSDVMFGFTGATNVTLRGANITASGVPPVNNSVDKGKIRLVSCTNVLIERCRIDGEMLSYAGTVGFFLSTDCTFRYNTVLRGSCGGYGNTRATWERNAVIDAQGNAMGGLGYAGYIDQDTKIIGNLIRGYRRIAIEMYPNDFGTIIRAVIDGNLITDPGAPIGGFNLMMAISHPGEQGQITNNRIEKFPTAAVYSAIEVSGLANICSDNTIIADALSPCSAIIVDSGNPNGSHGITVARNHIKNFSVGIAGGGNQPDYQLGEILIIDNDISDFDSQGIDIRPNSGLAGAARVEGNRLRVTHPPTANRVGINGGTSIIDNTITYDAGSFGTGKYDIACSARGDNLEFMFNRFVDRGRPAGYLFGFADDGVPAEYYKNARFLANDIGSSFVTSYRAFQATMQIESALKRDTFYTNFTPGSAVTLSDTASKQTLLLGSNCAITLPTYVDGATFELTVIQDGTGNRKATWPGTSSFAVAFNRGESGKLSTAPNAVDRYTFYGINLGGIPNWVGTRITSTTPLSNAVFGGPATSLTDYPSKNFVYLTAPTCAITLPAPTPNGTLDLTVLQDTTGGRAISFAGSVSWEYGTFIPPAQSVNGVTRYTFDAVNVSGVYSWLGKRVWSSDRGTYQVGGAAVTLTEYPEKNLVSLTAPNCVVTLPTPVGFHTFDAVFVQDSTGNRQVTWPSSVSWEGGVAQQPSPQPYSATRYTFEGTNVNGIDTWLVRQSWAQNKTPTNKEYVDSAVAASAANRQSQIGYYQAGLVSP